MSADRCKFRVWNKRTKEMIVDVGDAIMPHLCADGKLRIAYDNADVTDDLVIMFSTGTRDKAGKEIFEGDVVRLGDTADYDAQVLWIPEHASYGCQAKGKLVPYCCNIRGIECFAVAGNIYQNPELLTEGV